MFGQWLDEDGYLILVVSIITSLLQSTFHSQIGSSGFRTGVNKTVLNRTQFLLNGASII